MNSPPDPPTARFYPRSAMRFERYADVPGESYIARLVDPEVSRTIGAGIATFDGSEIDWTVLYDEVMVVLEGRFRLTAGGETFEAGPGDVFWIPEGTPLRYYGEKAAVFYAVYPVDWRQRRAEPAQRPG